ncbi:MAG: hypothetical protein Q9227_007345 [Pyrenula ochraceoflavens]
MEAAQIQIALCVLEHANIDACLDIEICVPAKHLEDAESRLCSTGLFLREELADYNVYTEYKRDRDLYLQPLQKHIVVPKKEDHAEFSPQLLDFVTQEQTTKLPWPRLPQYFTSLCLDYFQNENAMARIAAEQLIDGMNIDHAWCEKHLVQNPKILSLGKRLVDGKTARIDDFSPNLITCFIASEAEASRLCMIPGYE